MQRSLIWVRATIALEKLASVHSEEKPHLVLKDALQTYMLERTDVTLTPVVEAAKTFIAYEMTKTLDREAVKVLTKLSAVIY